MPQLRRVTIVGGGLFPRTVLVLRKVSPQTRITIMDSNLENLRSAQGFLEFWNSASDCPGGDALAQIEFIHQHYDSSYPTRSDLVIIPLAYLGDRSALYRTGTGPFLIHDWIWSKRGLSTIVSRMLLKRLNLLLA